MTKQRNERGVALLISLFALLLLTGIGLSMMFMSDTETGINANYKDSQRAYFAAAAGVQEARQRLMRGGDLQLHPALLKLPDLTGGVVYIRNPRPGEDVQPWDAASPVFDSELCHERFTGLGLADTAEANIPCADIPGGGGWHTEVASIGPFNGTAAALSYKWVRVTLKANESAGPDFPVTGKLDPLDNNRPVCWDGNNQVLLPAGFTPPDRCDGVPPGNQPYLSPVYRITALAVTATGSRRMAQMEVADNPPIVTNAAVDSQDHVTLNGQLVINGYDFCTCIKVVNPDGSIVYKDRLGKTCDKSKWAIYSAGTIEDATKSETIVAGQDPPTKENVDPWPYDIGGMISRYAPENNPTTVDVRRDPYNWTCDGVPPNCGTHAGMDAGVPPDFPPNPVDNPTRAKDPPISKQVTYVPGDAHLTGNAQGNGILVVDGDLVIDGGLQFYGLILVKGVIKFSGGGAEKTNIYGAVLAGQQSIDDTVIGGSASINYNACALRDPGNPSPPRMISAHEVSY